MIEGNLFANIPDSLPDEIFENLIGQSNFKLERILSSGQATPQGMWYDQEWDEWVILLSGSAELLFEGEDKVRNMRPGDFVNIPAHKRHRVEKTDGARVTVWLALHYEPKEHG